MASLRRMLILLFLSFIMIILSACFMMPLMVGGVYNSITKNKGDPKVKAAVSELLEESVDALDGERGLSERVLIGEIKVNGDLISVGKFRQILLETLRRKSKWQVIEQDDRADSALRAPGWSKAEYRERLTVLNTQYIRQEAGSDWHSN